MSTSAEKSSLAPGKVIGDYTVDSFIGRGAYGEVYRVHDQLNKNFALKLLVSTTASEREIQGLTELRDSIRSDAGLPLIYHVGKYEDQFYYTMDLADNAATLPGVYEPDTLENRLQKHGALPGKDCLQLIRQLLISVDALHQHALVHRDIKPANVIFLNGQPMLADLGLVTSTPRSLAGTIGFLPPYPPGGPTLETEKRGDLYSLGKVLYCAFTGEPVERFPLLPPHFSVQEYSAVRAVYLKACAEDPGKRFADVAEFRQTLDLAEQDLTGKCRKTPWKFIAAILILLLLGAIGICWKLRAEGSSQRRPAVPTAAGQHEAYLKLSLKNGVYQILCCFSCNDLPSGDPLDRANQFLAANLVKSKLSQELKVPPDRRLKVRDVKYVVQPFREGDLLIYIYEIYAADCLILTK